MKERNREGCAMGLRASHVERERERERDQQEGATRTERCLGDGKRKRRAARCKEEEGSAE